MSNLPPELAGKIKIEPLEQSAGRAQGTMYRQQRTCYDFLSTAFAYQPKNTLNFLFALIELEMRTVALSHWLDAEMTRLKATSGRT